jgi:hypothetical protein
LNLIIDNHIKMNKFLNKKTSSSTIKRTNSFSKPYPPSVIIKEVPVSGAIRAQIIGNSLGNFIDLRYYSGNTPTKRGIRIHLKSFSAAIEKLKVEIEKYAAEDED